ncbi:uncharacterized protein LOC119572524 [Penaeus monodon]|uniref:uncharacterized protein LOC119572524 n=1 Tax=Penaeus monodon TaxID=6687 RepID=UPI0018A72DC3|nr:uncharacterized protein LOC119572524 [Penaeus monodon]
MEAHDRQKARGGRIVRGRTQDCHDGNPEFRVSSHRTPTLAAKQICMEILMPSEEEMSSMKEKMKECLGNEGHAHLTSHPVLASDMIPDLKHVLCFREELKGITAESRIKVSICALQDHGVLDGEELNVPKVMEMLWTKINATQNSEAREFLTEAISELPELPRQPDMLHFIEVKKSLMNSCVMNMAMNKPRRH